MPLFRRRERRAWAGEPPIPTNTTPVAKVQGVSSPGEALRVPAVWACVRLLVDAVSMMSLDRYRDGEDGIPMRLQRGLLLEQPGVDRTMPEWLGQVVVSDRLRGNTYGVVIDRDRQGRPLQIELLNPDVVKVAITDDGKVEYRASEMLLDPADVWHLRAMTMPGDVVGMSPLGFAARTIGVAADAERFGAGFFSDGAHPSAVLTTDSIVDQPSAQAIKDRFRAAVNGREPVVLGLGVKYQPIQVTPEESQFLDTQKFSIAQIARVFGVPPEMIGGESGGSLTYSNIEQRSIDFLTYAVQPILTRIEASLSAMLPPGEYVRFDTSTLLRTDAETRAKVQALQVGSKTRVPSELRKLDGLAPFTPEQQQEADLVPLTVGPTGAVKPADPAADPAAAAPVVADVEQKGATVIVNATINTPPAETRVLQELHNHVDAAPTPDVHVDVHHRTEVAPVDVRVQHLPAPETPQLTRGATTKRIERNAQGDIVAIIEEGA